jgi:hypothetical protein
MKLWQDIRNSFEDTVGDTSGYFFSADTQARWANAALRDLCENARYKDGEYTRSVGGGVGEYFVVATSYAVRRVEVDDEVMYPITKGELRRGYPDFASLSGRPKFYYLDETGSHPDYIKVGLFEAPGTSLTMRVWHDAAPNPVANTTAGLAADVDVPDWAVGAVLFYMLALAYEADTKLRNVETARFYWGLYADTMERLVIRSRDRQPKRWVCGSGAYPSVNVLNRLPVRIPSP